MRLTRVDKLAVGYTPAVDVFVDCHRLVVAIQQTERACIEASLKSKFKHVSNKRTPRVWFCEVAELDRHAHTDGRSTYEAHGHNANDACVSIWLLVFSLIYVLAQSDTPPPSSACFRHASLATSGVRMIVRKCIFRNV